MSSQEKPTPSVGEILNSGIKPHPPPSTNPCCFALRWRLLIASHGLGGFSKDCVSAVHPQGQARPCFVSCPLLSLLKRDCSEG